MTMTLQVGEELGREGLKGRKIIAEGQIRRFRGIFVVNELIETRPMNQSAARKQKKERNI